MKKILIYLLPFVAIFLIVGSIIVDELPAVKQYFYVKNNLDTPTKLSFTRVPNMPEHIGQKETHLLSFQVGTFGPGSIKFAQGNEINFTLYIQNSAKQAMTGGKSCVLRDHADPTITYASIADWTQGSDGVGIKPGQYKINDLHFNNFGIDQNQTIAIQKGANKTIDLVCDTTNFIKTSQPSTLKANILTTRSISYNLTGVTSIQNVPNFYGTDQMISGIPLKGMELNNEDY